MESREKAALDAWLTTEPEDEGAVNGPWTATLEQRDYLHPCPAGMVRDAEDDLVCVVFYPEQPQHAANMRALTAAPELLTAAEAWEALDEHVANCEECEGGVFPELCEEGFPFADDLRLKMRAALAKARGNDPAA